MCAERRQHAGARSERLPTALGEGRARLAGCEDSHGAGGRGLELRPRLLGLRIQSCEGAGKEGRGSGRVWWGGRTTKRRVLWGRGRRNSMRRRGSASVAPGRRAGSCACACARPAAPALVSVFFSGLLFTSSGSFCSATGSEPTPANCMYTMTAPPTPRAAPITLPSVPIVRVDRS